MDRPATPRGHSERQPLPLSRPEQDALFRVHASDITLVAIFAGVSGQTWRIYRPHIEHHQCVRERDHPGYPTIRRRCRGSSRDSGFVSGRHQMRLLWRCVDRVGPPAAARKRSTTHRLCLRNCELGLEVRQLVARKVADMPRVRKAMHADGKLLCGFVTLTIMSALPSWLDQ